MKAGVIGGPFHSEDEDEEADEETIEWTEENIAAYARETLGAHDSLYFDPDVPKDKLEAARHPQCGPRARRAQGDSAALFPALREFIYEMASMAQDFEDEEEDE